MGAKQSQGDAPLAQEDLERVFTLPYGVWLVNSQKYAPDALSGYRFLDEAQRKRALKVLDESVSAERDRAIGCFLGLLVGDALGSPLEFHPVRYLWDPKCPRQGVDPLAGFNPALWEDKSDMRETNRFLLRMGQWTDDGSMALCLADSLLTHGGFHPRDLRLRFLLWWMLGYNNAFRKDNERKEVWGNAGSVGLGGIIGASLQEFSRKPADYTQEGDVSSSGNGSIMRNAPVAIMYRHDLDSAMDVAWRQSKTTHKGDEASDCARLITWICVQAIVSGEGKGILNDLTEFPARLYSTKCLAAAEQEERHIENTGSDLGDRDWRWRMPEFRYASSRSATEPGYVGSYCMDCLAMALHCIYATKTFEDAVLRAANLCGDADTVAAVTGQVAGALYGLKEIPEGWLREVEQWDDGDARFRACLLYEANKPTSPAVNEQLDGESWTELRCPEPTEVLVNESTKMPFACECNRRFANTNLFQMHRKKCKCASVGG